MDIYVWIIVRIEDGSCEVDIILKIIVYIKC